MANMFDMACPKCGDEDHIDITAQIAVRLTADGTDADISGCGEHCYDDDSPAYCQAPGCGFGGTLGSFRKLSSWPWLRQYTVILSDTLTVRRRVEVSVEAASTDAAKADVLARADEIMTERTDVEEEQIDNTPYQVTAYP